MADPAYAFRGAILAALVTVTTVYVVVTVAALGAQPWQDFEGQEAGLATILDKVTSAHYWGTVLAAGAVISIFSVTLVVMYGQTRILFSISRDGMVSRKFIEVNSRTMTPVYNTIVVSIVVALIGGFVPADYLWDTVSIGTLVAFSVVAIGIIVLRRTAPDLERPFKLPGYPVTPILTVAACAWIMWGLSAVTWLIFGVWIAIVFLFYLVYGRQHAILNHYSDPEEIAEPLGREDEKP